jgi:hypothetical protein
MKTKLLFLIFLLPAAAQQKGDAITVHVKEIHREQESTDKGAWIHITAVVETKTIVYSLKCDEFASVEKGYTMICSQLAAGRDYSGRRYATVISFWPPTEKDEEGGPRKVAYDILSEKEK